MRIKLILLFATLLPSIIAFQQPAHSISTKWEDVKVSFSELLNSGWQVIGHGTNRIAANSNSGNSFDVETFSFMLAKDGKYIICFVENPRPPVANAAGCRRLN